jgi:hypothetical protein
MGQMSSSCMVSLVALLWVSEWELGSDGEGEGDDVFCLLDDLPGEDDLSVISQLTIPYLELSRSNFRCVLLKKGQGLYSIAALLWLVTSRCG